MSILRSNIQVQGICNSISCHYNRGRNCYEPRPKPQAAGKQQQLDVLSYQAYGTPASNYGASKEMTSLMKPMKN